MPICVLCKNELNSDNWKYVEIVQDIDKVVQWVMCNWCAQVVKETFAE